MRQFPMAELADRTGAVTRAAERFPIIITRHRKPRLVMMSHDFYMTRKRAFDPRRVYRAEETPPEIREWLLPGLDRIASGNGYDD